MRTVPRLLRFLWIPIVAAILYLGWVFGFQRGRFGIGSPPQAINTAAKQEFDRTYSGDSVKIINFYPRDTILTEGNKTLLCYGVTNAKSVRIDPPVDGVSPALSRCVEVEPKHETHYTLTATGADGRSVSQSTSVQIGTDTSALPKITAFKVEKCSRDYTGDAIFSMTFADQNAEEVSIDPAAFQPLHGAPFGNFSARVAKTTTYTLTAAGKHGHVVKKQLTLDPGQCK
jgi:hypothetical protein